MEYGKAMTIYLSSLAADCFPARDCGPSVSMVITDKPRHYCVSSSQSIYYKLMYREIITSKNYFPCLLLAQYTSGTSPAKLVGKITANCRKVVRKITMGI